MDVNAVLATLLREDATSTARAFWNALTDVDEVVGPHVLLPECTSVLRRRVTEGRLTEAEGYELIDELLLLPIRINSSKEQFRIAFDLATRSKRVKTHDLQYLAVAEIERAQILTLDSGLRQAASERGVPVRFLR